MIGGGYSEQNEYDQHEKYLANEMRASILDRYVIGREICLHGFGGIAVSYISEIHFEILADGDTTGCIIKMIFFT